jgi:hypothetical protein
MRHNLKHSIIVRIAIIPACLLVLAEITSIPPTRVVLVSDALNRLKNTKIYTMLRSEDRVENK